MGLYKTPVPESSGLSIKEDYIKKTLQTALNIAQTTLVHIKKLRTKLPAYPEIEVTTPSFEGITSITHDLGLLENELQSPSNELLSQIQTDVSSLEGTVRSLAQTMDCSIKPRTTVGTSDNLFPYSLLYLTLTKVQHYLEQILLNKDKLKVC
ncbi:Leptin-B [Channa argus]|uniref:Leptin-B n=1 Tax=Channa argus TaxID=215402 RepID=A0A6G1QSG8_CHAAH|nr:Leptin-B [Channa argus]